jgi:hypothetical protein
VQIVNGSTRSQSTFEMAGLPVFMNNRGLPFVSTVSMWVRPRSRASLIRFGTHN